jgi:hypothetical protein
MIHFIVATLAAVLAAFSLMLVPFYPLGRWAWKYDLADQLNFKRNDGHRVGPDRLKHWRWATLSDARRPAYLGAAATTAGIDLLTAVLIGPLVLRFLLVTTGAALAAIYVGLRYGFRLRRTAPRHRRQKPVANPPIANDLPPEERIAHLQLKGRVPARRAPWHTRVGESLRTLARDAADAGTWLSLMRQASGYRTLISLVVLAALTWLLKGHPSLYARLLTWPITLTVLLYSALWAADRLTAQRAWLGWARPFLPTQASFEHPDIDGKAMNFSLYLALMALSVASCNTIRVFARAAQEPWIYQWHLDVGQLAMLGLAVAIQYFHWRQQKENQRDRKIRRREWKGARWGLPSGGMLSGPPVSGVAQDRINRSTGWSSELQAVLGISCATMVMVLTDLVQYGFVRLQPRERRKKWPLGVAGWSPDDRSAASRPCNYCPGSSAVSIKRPSSQAPLAEPFFRPT